MSNVVGSFAEKLRKKQGLPPSDGGGTYDRMEERVKRLEDDTKEMRSDLKAIRTDLAEIKGKLSGMPTTFQMIGVFATMNGLLLAGATLVIAISRYLSAP